MAAKNVKVQMLVNLSGTRNGQDWPKRGQTVELPADEAKELIVAGMAIDPKNPPVERSVPDVTDVETATTKRGPNRPISPRKA